MSEMNSERNMRQSQTDADALDALIETQRHQAQPALSDETKLAAALLARAEAIQPATVFLANLESQFLVCALVWRQPHS